MMTITHEQLVLLRAKVEELDLGMRNVSVLTTRVHTSTDRLRSDLYHLHNSAKAVSEFTRSPATSVSLSQQMLEDLEIVYLYMRNN